MVTTDAQRRLFRKGRESAGCGLMTSHKSSEADHREYAEAYLAGDYSAALSAASRGLIRQGLEQLRQDGLILDFNRPPKDAVEFFGSIAAVLEEKIAEMGDDATLRMIIVQKLAGALTDLQSCLSGVAVDDLNPADRMAFALLHAFNVGSTAEHLGLTASGHFDEFAELKFSHIKRREKQGAAARRTNEKKVEQRLAAIEAARPICAANLTLSNEELGMKVMGRMSCTVTVRTITSWMREARKSGDLPEIKAPSR